VKLWPYLAFLNDLIDVLPTRTVPEWTEVQRLEPGRPTVILVSGFGATRRNLAVIRRRFVRDGFNVLVIAMDWSNLSDGLRGFYRMAEMLASTVIALRKRADLRGQPIYLVAHSAGGLVARYYVQRLGGFHYCQALVTLGTPHRGTWLALLGFVTHLALKARCLIQMLPISRFVRAINRTRFPQDFLFLSVSSPQDFMCRPFMARLPRRWTDRPQVHAVALAGVSHSGFLLSKRVYALCLQTLRPGHADHPAEQLEKTKA
jgi:triacylglycerol lipase